MKRKSLNKDLEEKTLEECLEDLSKAWESFTENFVRTVKGTLIAYTRTLNKINELLEEANNESGNFKE